MAVLFVTNDLMFYSRVAAAADRAGLALQTVRSLEELTQPLLADGVELLILDLSFAAIDPAEWVAQLRELASEPPPVVAYAPHVHTAKLEAARSAGCTEVLTRGQFDRQMDALLKKYGGP